MPLNLNSEAFFVLVILYLALLTQKDIFKLFLTHGFLNSEVSQVMNDDQPVDECNHDQVSWFSMTKL
jgi:hypothetical protein